MQDYKQIARDGQSEIDVKGSQFICVLKKIQSEEEAQALIAEQRKAHKKATHHCFAYLIGPDDHIQRASDDGEPSGTAGVPMLEVLKKQEVHNVLAVVIRYFGGTKLGAGGLIRAYGSSVSKGLEEVGLVLHSLQKIYQLDVPYPEAGRLEHYFNDKPYQILDTQYSDKVTYRCAVFAQDEESFLADMATDFYTCPLDFQEEAYVDLPL